MKGEALTSPTRNEHLSFLRTRRSVRCFKSDPVPDSVIDLILESATFAPSAHNNQPWRFAVITTDTARYRLIEAIRVQFRTTMGADSASGEDIATRLDKMTQRTLNAQVVIILCMDKSSIKAQTDEPRRQAARTMAIQSVALAGLQLLLAAHAEGLGGTWICWPLYAQESIRECIDLSLEWEPQAMFFLGYPDETPPIPERLPLDQIRVIR
ncbi:MAG: nitroreductase family protein [Chloroflexota bacterium]